MICTRSPKPFLRIFYFVIWQQKLLLLSKRNDISWNDLSLIFPVVTTTLLPALLPLTPLVNVCDL